MNSIVILLVVLLSSSKAYALGFTQSNKDYVIHCSNNGKSWTVQEDAMVNNAHGLKICSTTQPSIARNVTPPKKLPASAITKLPSRQSGK